jgi:hypothetical protein
MRNPITAAREREARLEELEAVAQETEIIKERIVELEKELTGWRALSSLIDNDFSREALRTICRLAFIYFLKNPLIKRAVLIQTTYVFGGGVNIKAESDEVNVVIQDFLDSNKAEIWTQQALEEKENELQLFANLFFAFFPGKNGELKVRMIPFDEIDAKIVNPEDSRDVWYYVRTYMSGKQTKTALYPDWKHIKPAEGEAQVIADAGYGGKEIKQDVYIYHVAVNKIGKMHFGVSEVYAAIDWARAYKEFLENWTILVKSYSRLAWALVAQKKKDTDAASLKVRAMNQAQSGRPQVGDMAVMTAGYKLEPIKTGGATVAVDDSRRLLLMVCSAVGIYEHYFGDPSTGNLATSTSMERPMELKFQSRQSLWTDIYQDVLQYKIDLAVKYGQLPGNRTSLEIGKNEKGEQLSRVINVRFPDITQHDIKTRVDAVVSATTLNGQMPAGTIDLKMATRMLLEALEQDNIDETMNILFPPENDGKLPNGQDMPKDAGEALMIVKQLNHDIREKLKELGNAEENI